MSNATNLTIADLPRISREDLKDRLTSTASSFTTTDGTKPDASSSSPPSSSLAIIDVRGDDYIGGHIRGATNVPSTTLDERLPDLVRSLQNTETVVFHCALSQQRGPSAALRYIRERDRILGSGGGSGSSSEEKEGEGAGGEGEGGEKGGRTQQKVVVLDGGFVKWQEEYGMDEKLTEGYKKDIWENGY